MDYEKEMRIDETALDVEWLDQPTLMMKYCRHQAAMQQAEEEAKERLEFTIAKLDKHVRSDPEAFDIDKITESVVRNVIIEQDEYDKANTEYIEAKFENNVAKGAVRAMDQRKTSLENLVRLHGQQYFAGPKVPRDITEERKMKQDRADSKITIRTKKKR